MAKQVKKVAVKTTTKKVISTTTKKNAADNATSSKSKNLSVAKSASTKKSITPIANKASEVVVQKKAVAVKKSVVKKSAEIIIISDDTIDIEAFDLLNNAHIPLPKPKKSRGSVAAVVSACPQGKQPRVIRDNPHTSAAVNPANYITQLNVTISSQNLEVRWLNGTIENWLCSPNPSLTPKVSTLVGIKCGAKHTNMKRDGMAWFTALAKYGMAYGFHNSQRVGIGIVSHGCIRVSCEHAKIINQHSWSGKTKIKIVR